MRSSPSRGWSRRRAGRIADLDERLDRRGDRVGIGVGEELAEELHHAGLGDLGEQVRQLGERGRADREALERALDAAGDLLEAVEGQLFQLFAGGLAGLGVLGREHVDQRVDDARAVVLAEERGDAHEAKRGLVFVGLLQRGGERGGEGVEQRLGGERGELVVEAAHAALGVEELVDGPVDRFTGLHGERSYQVPGRSATANECATSVAGRPGRANARRRRRIRGGRNERRVPFLAIDAPAGEGRRFGRGVDRAR